MRWQVGFLFCFIMTGVIAGVSAEPRYYIDSTRTRLLQQAQSAVLDDRFDLADSIAQEVIELDRGDPAGYVSLAASQLARMADAEENIYGQAFTRRLDSLTEICEQSLATASSERAAWLNLFLGHTQAYRALYESRFGSGYRAVRMGLRTNDSYEAGLTADSALYDLYFGLGSYHYWKSVKAGVFRWIGIFHNDIELGIRELQLAADSSLLSGPVALLSLAWVWLDRERYDSVVAVTRPLVERFPHGKSFLWPLARAQYDSKDYAGAIATYARLRTLLEENPGNHFNLIECDFYLARCREKLEQKTEAVSCAGQLASYERYVSGDVRRRQADKIQYLKRLAGASVTTVSTEP